MAKNTVVVAALLLLCGACGGKKESNEPRMNDGTLGGPHQDAPDQSGRMVTPEKMEEITRLLNRKGNIISKCLSKAVDNQELPKNSRGKITLDITISPSGKADAVKIIKASLDSPSLHECVVSHVKEIQFPEIPTTYPTSHTYAFEAM
ncbi:MAG: AgmX/PglI C-terminal domain-containing protein [Deltaproteobacteria bacterium]|nr:AgmX/PglI C-terminal domain-containing protein [Deltaproteobacteria bacterium]